MSRRALIRPSRHGRRMMALAGMVDPSLSDRCATTTWFGTRVCLFRFRCLMRGESLPERTCALSIRCENVVMRCLDYPLMFRFNCKGPHAKLLSGHANHLFP